MARKLLTLILAVIMLLSFAACMYDGHPKEDTPDPPALNGVFISGENSFTFSGDGRSITMNISGDFAALSGLPYGESEAQYVFLLSVGGEYRYDKAEYFRIIIGDINYQFRNEHGATNENTVAFYPTDDAVTSVRFEKN